MLSLKSSFRYRVLVADDDPQIHKIISRFLDPSEYEVESALNGKEALQKLEENPYALVILDLMMPEMNGFEVCRKFKNSPLGKKTKIVILSAKDTPNDRSKCLALGAEDYVSKPFHLSTFGRKIKMLCQRASRLSS